MKQLLPGFMRYIFTREMVNLIIIKVTVSLENSILPIAILLKMELIFVHHHHISMHRVSLTIWGMVGKMYLWAASQFN